MGFGSIYWVPKKKKKKVKLSKSAKSRAKIPYKKYLESDYWKSVRAAVLKRDRYRCVKCGDKKKLEVHHLNYTYRGDELNHLFSVSTLCWTCHRIEHQDHTGVKNRVKLRKRNLD